METIQRALDLAARQSALSPPRSPPGSQPGPQPGPPGGQPARIDAAAGEVVLARIDGAVAGEATPINDGAFGARAPGHHGPRAEPPRRLPLDWAALRESRVVDRDDRRPAAGAYRMLRTQVLQRARAHAISTIGVVSAANGEGKTLTAINLSLSLAAEPNHSIMLVDLDLRRPSVAQLLRLPVERGLESWFAGQATIEELSCALEGVERLTLLPTLAPVPGSAEALAAVETAGLLRDLKQRDPGRLTIVDLPPVLLTADALTVAPHLDAVVLVVTEGRTRREDVGRVLELLGSTRVIGTVLNRSSESERRAY